MKTKRMKNNQKSRNAIIAAAVTTVFTVVSSDAAITVLKLTDTVGGFSTSTAGLVIAGAPAIGTIDNAWGFDSTNTQALLGTGVTANLAGYVWGSRVDLGENAPTLATVISGLSSGVSYDIYGYYAVETTFSFDWGIQLGLDGGTLTTYNKTSGVSEQTTGNVSLRRVLIGQVSGVTTATVNIDDIVAGANDRRSFVKGIGVEAVPEPGLPLIASLSLVVLAVIRRRV